MAGRRKVTRDVRTGRFVATERARTAPAITVTEVVPVEQPSRKVNRDARTGRFVPRQKATTAPTRTFTQSIHVPPNEG